MLDTYTPIRQARIRMECRRMPPLFDLLITIAVVVLVFAATAISEVPK